VRNKGLVEFIAFDYCLFAGARVRDLRLTEVASTAKKQYAGTELAMVSSNVK
jgi:hypothetical protein